MKLIDLIRQNSWLSVELTLLDIYHEEKRLRTISLEDLKRQTDD